MAKRTLARRLKPIAEHAKRSTGKRMSEENTKNKIVVPILQEVGWLLTEFDFPSQNDPVPVDIRLPEGNPVLYVEVKAIDTKLDPEGP